MRRFQLYLLFILCVMCMLLVETGVRFSWNWTRFNATSPPLVGHTSNLTTEKWQIVADNKLRQLQQQLNDLWVNDTIATRDRIATTPSALTEKFEVIKETIKEFRAAPNPLLREDAYQSIKSHPEQGRFSFPPFSPLNLMPVIDPNVTNISRVLLVTYFRSGSSFLGDLLQQNWKTFYTFEPLHLMSDGKRVQDERRQEAVFMTRKIFECDFLSIPEYLKWVTKPENRFLFKWNTFLWSVCRFRPHNCFNASFVREVCIRAPVHVMKATRLHLRYAEDLLGADLDLKVVFLVRDPRAIYSSRKVLSWCGNSTCSDASTLCAEMQQDLDDFDRLEAAFPGHLFLTRYEDLALKPLKQAEKLFRDLDITFSPQANRYLKTHTALKKVSESRNPYSTKRNSKSVVFEWKQKLLPSEIFAVEKMCSRVLTRLGYKLIGDKVRQSGDFPIDDDDPSGETHRLPVAV